MSKIKSKHNNLLNYFLYDHKYLSKKYLRKSKKFLKELTTERINEKMKKGTVINYKGTEIKIPFDIAVNLNDLHKVHTVTNEYSGRSTILPNFAVAVYQTIKGAEVFYNAGDYKLASTMNKGREWFQKYFTQEYYVLLD